MASAVAAGSFADGALIGLAPFWRVGDGRVACYHFNRSPTFGVFPVGAAWHRGFVEWSLAAPGLLCDYETSGTSSQAIKRYAYSVERCVDWLRIITRVTRRTVACRDSLLPPVAMTNVAFYGFLPVQCRNEDLQL